MFHISRIICIASSNASTASAGVREGPPYPIMAFQKAPAPTPNSTHPFVSMSKVAADLACRGGCLNGTSATLIIK
jgi:hypothetical protein